MKHFHIYLLLSGLFHNYQLIELNYIYKELGGFSLSYDELKFSIFLKNFHGLLLYCIDSNNKLLIELSKVQSEKTIDVKYNYYAQAFSVTELKLDFCFNQPNVYFKVLLQLKNTKIEIECKNQTRTLILSKRIHSDQFKDYPRPNHDFNLINKMFIWMGNIGPYIGLDDQITHPLTKQLLGCVDLFRINEENIEFPKHLSNFSFSCNEKYFEHRCNKKDCSELPKSYKIYDCSILTMNLKHCITDLSNYADIQKSYKTIKKNKRSDYLRIEWKNKQIDQKRAYCLLEIKLEKNVFILFYVDQENSIVMETLNIDNDKMSENYLNVPTDPTQKNILLIYLKQSEMIIKIYNGKEIFSYSITFIYEFKLINIGFFQHQNLYKSFDGDINFQYDTNTWTAMSEVFEIITTSQSNNREQKFSKIIILVVVATCIVIVVIIVMSMIFRMKSKLNKKTKTSSKRSKSPSPNHYDLETNDVNSHEKMEMEYETFPDNNDDGYERFPEAGGL